MALSLVPLVIVVLGSSLRPRLPRNFNLRSTNDFGLIVGRTYLGVGLFLAQY